MAVWTGPDGLRCSFEKWGCNGVGHEVAFLSETTVGGEMFCGEQDAFFGDYELAELGFDAWRWSAGINVRFLVPSTVSYDD